MPQYRCIGHVVGSKYLGIVEAANEDEAAGLAEKKLDTGISLCYQCSLDVSDLVVETIIVEEIDE